LAASAAGGGDPVALATAWGAGDTGRQLDAQERDLATWQRVASVLDRAAEPLLGG
ncbi:xylulose kinase, partial [Streptomyces nanshensis]